ncbi:MAG: hypothetical protein JSV08_05265 [Acidobacteriota bacterium]|nr:MAG: hypothetical protein JSV08_05265 [Acidobacteriota bacterium]
MRVFRNFPNFRENCGRGSDLKIPTPPAHRSMARITLGAAAFLGLVGAAATAALSPKAGDAAANPPADRQAGPPGNRLEKDLLALPPKVYVPEWEWSAGTLLKEQQTLLTHTFRLENHGDGLLEIFSIHPSSLVETFDVFAMPGGAASVRVRLPFPQLPYGPFLKTFTVLTNDPERPKHLLRVRGIKHTLLQTFPEWTAVRIDTFRGYVKKRRFVLHSEHAAPLKIYEAACSTPHLQIDLEKAANPKHVETELPQDPKTWARRGDIIMTLSSAPDAPVGVYNQEKITLRTNLELLPEHTLDVSLLVKEMPELLGKQL